MNEFPPVTLSGISMPELGSRGSRLLPQYVRLSWAYSYLLSFSIITTLYFKMETSKPVAETLIPLEELHKRPGRLNLHSVHTDPRDGTVVAPKKDE